MTQEELLHWDKNHVWHPYAAMPNTNDTFVVESTEGVYLNLSDGRKLIDGMSSWWSAIHGYNHPRLKQAINQQLETMPHVMFGGLTHEPAIQLCKTLVDITPSGLNKVFLADSGSVAVEVAIKMALQFWQSSETPSTDKTRLLALKGGYHGDTFGAMATCDPVNGMHHLFSSNMPQHFFADKPNVRFNESSTAESNQLDIASLKTQLEQHHNDIAAVILEPIVQGAGGMWFYSAHYLKRVRELCDEFNVLLIADEIATGFGRTGKLFACEHADISPDILCLGKALTGGTLTLAATLCNDKVANGIATGESSLLMHGPTFMGNPLACAAANASLEVLLSTNWQQNVQRIETQLQTELAPAINIKGVDDVRVLGAIGVIELDAPVDMAVIQPLFVEHGIWLRPFGKLVYMMPAYVMSYDELKQLCEKTQQVLVSYLLL